MLLPDAMRFPLRVFRVERFATGLALLVLLTVIQHTAVIVSEVTLTYRCSADDTRRLLL